MNKYLSTIPYLLCFSIYSQFIYSPTAHSYEETWGTLALRSSINDEQQVMGEWRRRDSENQVLAGDGSDLFRLSLNTKFEGFSYLAGLTYADYETNASHEVRLHQFLSFKLLENELALFGARIGTEHRDFSSDNTIYHRARMKLQLNPLPQYRFGASLYNEAFFALNGGNRFATGFNENRTGFGARWTFKAFEIYAYHTLTYLKSPRGKAHQEWLQFQLVFNL